MRRDTRLLSAGVLIAAAVITLSSHRARRVDLSERATPDRIERPCGPSSDRTAIIIVHGQSNAANYGSSRYVAKQAVDNFDPATGKCFAAVDPLLGADGLGGNFATPLGDMLIEAGRYSRVILVPIAVGGASVAMLNNEFAGRMENVILKLKAAGLTPTHVLFQQGEKDAELTTTQEQYVSELHQLVARLRSADFDAPFYLAQSTKCDIANPKNVAAVRSAQQAALDAVLNIRRGPDTDTIGNDGRNPDDGCHMNQAGTLANAALWAAIIEKQVDATHTSARMLRQPLLK